MKKSIIILAAIAMVSSLASCNRLIDFDHETFGSFTRTSYSAKESAGTLTIPVQLYNPTGSASNITVSVTGDTAVKGTDFEIADPASGVLTFNGDETEKNITIKILPHVGTFTGDLDFTLTIAGGSDGVSVGAYNSVSVSIKDEDHPLSAFIGEWKGSTISDYDGSAIDIDMNISAVDGDITKLSLQGFDPTYGVAKQNIVVTVSSDKKSFTIADKTPTGATYSSYGAIFVRGLDAVSYGAANDFADITVTLEADGRLYIKNGFVSMVSAGWLDRIHGDYYLSK